MMRLQWWLGPARFREGRFVRRGHDPVWRRVDEPVLVGRHAVDDRPTEQLPVYVEVASESS